MTRGGFMRGFLAIAAAVMLAAALCGCRKADGDSLRVQQEGVLNVAVVEGEQQLLPVAEFIAQDIGVEVEYHTAADNQGALELLNAGVADVAVAYFHLSYGGNFVMTMPFGSSYVYAVTRQEDLFGSFSVLNQRRLCADTQLDTFVVNSVSNVSACEVDAAKSAAEAAQQLIDGDIDAYFCSEESAFQMLSDAGGLRCGIIPEFERMEYRAVMRNDSDLYEQVNAAIAKMTADR